MLELTVMRLSYNFNFSAQYPILLIVLWALGLSMIGLAALVWIPERWLAALSVATIALHNCLDGVQGSGLWNLIHRPGAFRVAGQLVIVAYPLVPWIAVMSAGFCCGRVFLMEAQVRRKILLATGGTVTLAFVIVRAWNVMGNPAPGPAACSLF